MVSRGQRRGRQSQILADIINYRHIHHWPAPEIVTPELRPATRRRYERLFSESNLILTLTACFVIVEELNFITNITETIETSQFLENCDNKVRGHPVVTSKQ